ncbi:MAG: hypothetical protein AAGA22_06325 [Pseudomonadota bacterium]
MNKFFLCLTALFALTGCFQSKTPIGDNAVSVHPDTFVSFLPPEYRDDMRYRVEGNNWMVFDKQGDGPFDTPLKLRFFPVSGGNIVVESAPFMMLLSPGYSYSYIKLNGPQPAAYVASSSDEALTPQLAEVFEDIKRSRTTYADGLYFEPRSIEDVARTFEILIAAGLTPMSNDTFLR